MKRLGMLLILLSVTCFALGCKPTKKETKPPVTPPPAGVTEEKPPVEGAAPVAPAEPEKK
jgi:hypothetical protein